MVRRSSISARRPRPEVLAFLGAIKENPEDDTPRLMLADWLEERGDPRGEFIRLQCRRARPGPGDTEPSLSGPEQALLEKHGSEWLGVLSEKGISTEFRRGLVRVAGGPRKLLTKRLAALPPTEAFAWVDHLRVYDMNAAAVTNLARSPHWTSLTCLDLGGQVYYADHLVSARYSVGIGPPGAIALASVPALSQVSELRLDCNDIGAEGMAALAAVPALRRLRTLNLRCNNLRDEGASALAASRSFPGLTELVLYQNRIGPQGFAALAQWPGLSRVTTLNLSCNYPGAKGTAALAASPHLGCLTELRLCANDLGAVAGLGPYQFGPKGAEALSSSVGLNRLAILRLSGNGIGPKGAAALATSRHLTGLVELDLSVNKIGDQGAIALASSSTLSGLVRLDLRYNGIGNRGALALASSPSLSNLKYLGFCANRKVGPAALRALWTRFGTGLDTEQSIRTDSAP